MYAEHNRALVAFRPRVLIRNIARIRMPRLNPCNGSDSVDRLADRVAAGGGACRHDQEHGRSFRARPFRLPLAHGPFADASTSIGCGCHRPPRAPRRRHATATIGAGLVRRSGSSRPLSSCFRPSREHTLLVGSRSPGSSRRRCTHNGEVLLALPLPGPSAARSPASAEWIRRRHHDAGVQINCMFWPEGQVIEPSSVPAISHPDRSGRPTRSKALAFRLRSS